MVFLQEVFYISLYLFAAFITATPSPNGHARSPAGIIYSLDKPLPEPPYHVFTLAKKKQVVYIVSAAAIFSPLSSNIYFPALGQISVVRWWPLSEYS
jgi:hypothetical protein